MAYTSIAGEARGIGPTRTRPAAPSRRRNLWRRAFVRMLAARRRAAAQDIAGMVNRGGFDLPVSASPRLRRIVHFRQRAARRAPLRQQILEPIL